MQPLRRINAIHLDYKNNAVNTAKEDEVEKDYETRIHKAAEEFPHKYVKDDPFGHHDILEKLMTEEKEDQKVQAQYNATSTKDKTILDCKKQLMDFLKNENKNPASVGKDLSALVLKAVEKSAPNPSTLSEKLNNTDAKEVIDKTDDIIVSAENDYICLILVVIK